MRLGIISEPEWENRVAIVPNSIKKLKKAGFDVFVESGAGLKSYYSDSQYIDAGAIICDRSDSMSCEIIITINMLEKNNLRNGMILACMADPFRNPISLKNCLESGVTLFSMDMIPRRLSRAQSMDVNSSQDNLAGYKAVLLGASYVPKGIPMICRNYKAC
ncbi:MAG: hypothetical protein ACKVGY_05145 [Candidatus Poseidoniales archaeon]